MILSIPDIGMELPIPEDYSQANKVQIIPVMGGDSFTIVNTASFEYTLEDPRYLKEALSFCYSNTPRFIKELEGKGISLTRATLEEVTISRDCSKIYSKINFTLLIDK